MGSGHSRPTISVVIPTLNEEHNLPEALRAAAAEGCELLVVDGGSADGTAAAARRHRGAALLAAPRGRGPQMNAGARAARSDVLLFCHADCRLPPGWPQLVAAALGPRGGGGGSAPSRQWGCFESIAPGGLPPAAAWALRHAVALRTRLLGRPYGDQALFVTRAAFEAAGGFPEWPLLEDVELAARLRARCGPPALVPRALRTSGRRWAHRGLLRTTVENQALLLRHALGLETPHAAAARYRRGEPHGT